jgi:hypothetical protein
MRIPLLACLAATVPLAAGAYTLRTTPTGIPLRAPDAANLQFLVNQSTAAGMMNADGNVEITADSDPMSALQAAAAVWNNLPTSTVSFLPLQTTAAVNDPTDNQHVIVFLDTPENRSVVGSALAVTFFHVLTDGTITDSDVIFNPTATFSTNLAPKTYDLQSVAAHEMGHALGANHSGLLASTMFQGVTLQNNSPASLSADDVAFASDTYPASTAAASYGVISGTVSLTTGEPVFGALVVAVDPAAGITVGGLSSLTDGTYSFKVPRGSYLLYAEPADGVVTPANLYLTNDQVNTFFQTTFAGGLASPQMVDVTSGQAKVNLAVAVGAAPFNLQALGTGSVLGSGDFEIAAGPTVLTGAQAVDLVLYGPGLDSLGAQYDVRLLGPGLTVRPNSVHVDTNTSVLGSRLLRMTVVVTPQPSPVVASIIVVKNSVAAALSGALLVLPAAPTK